MTSAACAAPALTGPVLPPAAVDAAPGWALAAAELRIGAASNPVPATTISLREGIDRFGCITCHSVERGFLTEQVTCERRATAARTPLSKTARRAVRRA